MVLQVTSIEVFSTSSSTTDRLAASATYSFFIILWVDTVVIPNETSFLRHPSTACFFSFALQLNNRSFTRAPHVIIYIGVSAHVIGLFDMAINMYIGHRYNIYWYIGTPLLFT